MDLKIQAFEMSQTIEIQTWMLGSGRMEGGGLRTEQRSPQPVIEFPYRGVNQADLKRKAWLPLIDQPAEAPWH